MSRFSKTFFKLLHSYKPRPIYLIPLAPLTLFSATTFSTGNDYEMDKNAILEPTFESSKKNKPLSEEKAYLEMENNLKKTQEKLSSKIFSTNKLINFSINNYNSNIIHKNALKLDTKIESNWNDFYENIDLIFTNDETDLNSDNSRARMERIVRATQEHFCYEMEKLEDNNNIKFSYDLWKRPQNKTGKGSKYSGGLAKVLQNSKIFEKAGVSVSISSGVLPPSAIKQMSANHDELKHLLVC